MGLTMKNGRWYVQAVEWFKGSAPGYMLPRQVWDWYFRGLRARHGNPLK